MSSSEEPQGAHVQVSDRELGGRVEAALRRLRGRATVADVTVATGVPEFRVEPLLRQFLPHFAGHLEVTSSGELIYVFPPAVTPPEATLGARLRRTAALVGDALYRAFRALFKVCIAGVVIFYFVLFLLVLLGIMVAVLARRDGDSDRSGGGSSGGGGLAGAMTMRAIFDLFFYSALTGPASPSPRLRRARGRERHPGDLRKGLLQSFFDFVFGPPAPRPDPLERERSLLAYIRDRRGRITTADLVALTGMPLAEVEREVVRLMVEYEGDVEVTDDGHLVYSFSRLRRTVQEGAPRALDTGGEPRRPCWEEAAESLPVTGNTRGMNGLIIGMNAFNLAGAMYLSGILTDPGLNLLGGAFRRIDPGALDVAFFWIPLIYSLLFFLVPAIRAVLVSRENERRRHGNRLRRRLRAVFERRGAAATPEEIEPGLDPAADDTLRDFVVPYGGDVQVDADTGRVRLAFPRLASELAAVDAARRSAPGEETEPGEIVFDGR